MRLTLWAGSAFLFAIASMCNGLSQSSANFRYFYDDSAQMFRVLDSTGTLLEYIYDPNGNITQINRSTVAPTSLSILSLQPFTGLPGQTITIYGQNFSATPSANTVMINGVAATVVSASSTALAVTVPAGATSGQVSVTVNGVTVSSGNLNFNVIGPPVITSITPPYATLGQKLTGVVIQGINLDGAQFYLNGGGFVSLVSVGSTQATVNITAGQAPGTYVLTAIGNSGPSSSQAANGNIFDVYYTPGNNFADLLVTVLNAAGPNPLIPTGSHEADAKFTVLNTFGATPLIPTGDSETDLLASVLNTAGPNPLIPTGSNEADELFSTMNTADPPARRTSITLRPVRGGRNGAEQLLSDNISAATPLCAGRTVEVWVDPPFLPRHLELDADSALLAASSGGILKTLFTAPFHLNGMDLEATGSSDRGPLPPSPPQHLQFCPDPGQQVFGRVTGADGFPVAGAAVTWKAAGLSAEYFRFDREAGGLPDLGGRHSEHTGYITALNFPNPRGVFGEDPMGAEAGANYAARFAGKIQVETAGEHRFHLLLHGGARLCIDGKEIAQGLDAAGIVEVEGAAILDAGAHEIEVVYYQSFGNPALVLSWAQPGRSMEIVPPAALTAEAMPASRAVTDENGKFVLTLPAALGAVQVGLLSGKGTVTIEQGNVIR